MKVEKVGSVWLLSFLFIFLFCLFFFGVLKVNTLYIHAYIYHDLHVAKSFFFDYPLDLYIKVVSLHLFSFLLLLYIRRS